MENNYSISESSLMSDDIREIVQALQKAKREFRSTGKSGTNSHQKYAYATLADIYAAVEEALDKNNIIIVHNCKRITEAQEMLCTRLIHTTSGQWLEDQRNMDYEKPGNQAKGATNTYMKKYAVLGLCSITQEDDDGESIEQYHNSLITKLEQIINKMAEPAKVMSQLLNRFKVNSLRQIRSADLQKIIENLTK